MCASRVQSLSNDQKRELVRLLNKLNTPRYVRKINDLVKTTVIDESGNKHLKGLSGDALLKLYRYCSSLAKYDANSQEALSDF